MQTVMPGEGQADLAYRLFVRKGSPILYTPAGTGSTVTVAMDEAVAPVVTNGQATWTVNVSPGTRTYLHFVNYGQASGALARLRTTMN